MSRRSRNNSRARRAHHLAEQGVALSNLQATLNHAVKVKNCLYLALAQASDELRQVKELLAVEQRRGAEAIEFRRRLVKLLGVSCMATGVPSPILLEGARRQEPDAFRATRPGRHPVLRYGDSDIEAPRIKSEIMRLMRIDSVVNHMQGLMHYHVHLKGCRAAYAISDTALRDMPHEDLVAQLAGEMAQLLVHEIKQRESRPQGRSATSSDWFSTKWGY